MQQKTNKFIVLEGLDGAGKSTQTGLLKDYLHGRGFDYRYLHFPLTHAQELSPIYGRMVADFLRGEYGELDRVHPRLAALLYAGDRGNVKDRINRWLDQGYFMVADRYVYSNMAYQGARCADLSQKRELDQWIHELEYRYHGIPRPDISLFLHMDFEFVRRQLESPRSGADREYLGGKDDIHEASLDLQRRVEKEYLRLVEENGDFHRVDCFEDSGRTLSPREIHQKIIDLLIGENILSPES